MVELLGSVASSSSISESYKTVMAALEQKCSLKHFQLVQNALLKEASQFGVESTEAPVNVASKPLNDQVSGSTLDDYISAAQEVLSALRIVVEDSLNSFQHISSSSFTSENHF